MSTSQISICYNNRKIAQNDPRDVGYLLIFKSILAGYILLQMKFKLIRFKNLSRCKPISCIVFTRISYFRFIDSKINITMLLNIRKTLSLKQICGKKHSFMEVCLPLTYIIDAQNRCIDCF